jgi:hypothetical protein
MSPRDVLEELAPAHYIGIPLRDARSVRRITQGDLKDALRLERGGPHRAELDAVLRHWDGGAASGIGNGHGAGYYASLFVSWRSGTQTYRSGGVRILLPEAERIARALDRGTGTQPGSSEADRISGGPMENKSELRATALGDGAVLVYVKFRGQGGKWYRSRGVEVHADEREAIAAGLREFVKMRGRRRPS